MRTSASDPKQGTAFSEIVALPTFAPHLAREYHAPGTPAFIAARDALQARLQAQPDQSSSQDGPDDGSDTPEASDATANAVPGLVLGTGFFINVVIIVTKTVKSGRSGSKQIKHPEPRQLEKQTVLTMTRENVIKECLAPYDLRDVYTVTANGPPFCMTYTGMDGGVSSTPKVRADAEWASSVQRLGERVATGSRTARIPQLKITFEMNEMEPWRSNFVHPSHAHLVLGADAQRELTFGTHIPAVSTYSADTVALASIGDSLKLSWPCAEHGACYIGPDDHHFELTRFRLNAWARHIHATPGSSTASPPPAELVSAWEGPLASSRLPTGAPAKASRGRLGPGASQDGSAMQGVLAASLALLTQNLHPSGSKSTKHNTPPASPVRQSSPPPSVDDELLEFLSMFRKTVKITEQAIDQLRDRLDKDGYSPASLCEVDKDHLVELTGLPQGQALALRRFARTWSERIEGKRLRASRK